MGFSAALFLATFALTCLFVRPELRSEIVDGAPQPDVEIVDSVSMEPFAETPSPNAETGTEFGESRDMRSNTAEVSETAAETHAPNVETTTETHAPNVETTTETMAPNVETTETGDSSHINSVAADAVSETPSYVETTTETTPPNVETTTETAPQKVKSTRSLRKDAVPEPTPEICPDGIKCGFQIYTDITRLPSQPFIKYCSCPEGTFCVKAGENMNMRFFYYRCKHVLTPDDEVMPEEFTFTQSLLEIFNLVALEDEPGDRHITVDMKAKTAFATSTKPSTANGSKEDDSLASSKVLYSDGKMLGGGKDEL